MQQQIDKCDVSRIRLRKLELADLPVLYEFSRDPASVEMAVVNPRSERDFFETWEKRVVDPSVTIMVILLDENVVGNVSCFDVAGDATIGYWIDRRHWGRGIATHALRLFLQEVTIRPLHAQVADTNGGSKRVLERCGFVCTGCEMSVATEQFPACMEARYLLEG